MGGVGGVGGAGGANRPSQLPAGGAGGNNWQHNPAHRGGAPYGDRATADRFGGAARGDSLANRQAGARNQIGRQGGNLPSNRGGAGASNRMNAGGAGGQSWWRRLRRRSRPRRKPRCLPSLRRRPQRLRIRFPAEATTVPPHDPPVAADPPVSVAAVAVAVAAVAAAAGVVKEKP